MWQSEKSIILVLVASTVLVLTIPVARSSYKGNIKSISVDIEFVQSFIFHHTNIINEPPILLLLKDALGYLCIAKDHQPRYFMVGIEITFLELMFQMTMMMDQMRSI